MAPTSAAAPFADLHSSCECHVGAAANLLALWLAGFFAVRWTNRKSLAMHQLAALPIAPSHQPPG